MLKANPALSALITRRIGKEWIDEDFSHIARFAEFANDDETLEELGRIKQGNKERLAMLVGERAGTYVSPNSMFIAHVKRIHEYKRQLLCVLHVISSYLELRSNPNLETQPRTYVFAGKAAAGYAMAKLHIKLINAVAEVVNFDPLVKNRLKVAFIPNYGVSLAEVIIPAADLSVQISLAGKEASGTGNMKFAMNGALTIGTLDGANIEIREQVGAENVYLCGLDADEVKAVQRAGDRPDTYVERSDRLREVVELIESGFFSPGDHGLFHPISHSLRHHDPFMVCADFDAYQRAEEQAMDDYADARAWASRALSNIAGSARFSSDETIRHYAEDIWGLPRVPIDLERYGV
jgi:starch phosphorylase